ncbi:hypothetical protein [Neomegalonema sp.]|uniref:hypothetical protein n=1 Tax=Neomegalonema sp. TaxID=2039713 RepID=UPI00260C5670|nr:hypothetical protein [Neomegalonema sp.]MDD2869966.1 hypothetical protein [Neomegalonema sp.]
MQVEALGLGAPGFVFSHPTTATDRAQRFLASADPEELAVNPWVTTEFSAALSIKMMAGSDRSGGAQRRAGGVSASDPEGF